MQEFGKTTFISVFARLIKNMKVLIIDFDLNNNNLHSVFGVRQLPQEVKKIISNKEQFLEFKLNAKNLGKLTIKIDRRLKLISKTKLIFDDEYKIDKDEMKEIIQDMIKLYDLILIDTSSDTKYESLTKSLVEVSDKVFCLVEGNLITIRKSIKLLKKYETEKRKLSVIYNKKNEYTLDSKILKIIFLKYKMIGSIKQNNRYNKIINANVKKKVISKDIRSEFEKIIRKIK